MPQVDFRAQPQEQETNTKLDLQTIVIFEVENRSDGNSKLDTVQEKANELEGQQQKLQNETEKRIYKK